MHWKKNTTNSGDKSKIYFSIEIMSNHHDDETLFTLEMGEARCSSGDGHHQLNGDQASAVAENDDDNRFVDNDTGADLRENK